MTINPNFLTLETAKMLATIVRNASAAGDLTTPEEVINALICEAYGRPHGDWERMLVLWKNRTQERS